MTQHHALRSLFDDWCDTKEHTATDCKGQVLILTEKIGGRDLVKDKLVQSMHEHYVDPKQVAKLIEKWGYKEAAAIMAVYLPSSKRARSGDMGEILAANITKTHLDFLVPVNRLRWKDGRNTALRGDDLIGMRVKDGALTALLKGESKSRATLTHSVIEDACDALKRDNGNPSPHSLVFHASRLREADRVDLAELLEDFLVVGRPYVSLHHLVFTLSGNAPAEMLKTALNATYHEKISRVMIGIVINDHQAFISDLFDTASA